MTTSPIVNAAMSLVPYLDGDEWSHKKAEYLAFRFTGFSVREATKLAEIAERTVQLWRAEEARFKDLENA